MYLRKKKFVSEVGFEPTPSFEDQNAHFTEAKSISLESGALDRSAILTCLPRLHFQQQQKKSEISNCDILKGSAALQAPIAK